MSESIPTTESIKALTVWASVQDLPDDKWAIDLAEVALTAAFEIIYGEKE